MAKDLSVELDDRPGTLADMGEALGKAGINIGGICGASGEGKGLVHILVEDPSSARRVLKDIGVHVLEERNVLILDVHNRPGELGKLCRKIATAGVNINLAYFSLSGMVIGVDDLDKARAALA